MPWRMTVTLIVDDDFVDEIEEHFFSHVSQMEGVIDLLGVDTVAEVVVNDPKEN